MIMLLTAFALYQFDANVWWWSAFGFAVAFEMFKDLGK